MYTFPSSPSKHLFILQQHEPWEEKKKQTAIICFFQSGEVNMELSHLLHQMDAIYLTA